VASITDAGLIEALKHLGLLNTWVAPSTLWMALSTTNPTADGLGVTEPVGNNYSRITITGWTQALSTDTFLTNTNIVQWSPLTGTWGTLTGYALYNQSTGGSVWAYGDLTSDITPVTSDTVFFPAGKVYLRIK